MPDKEDAANIRALDAYMRQPGHGYTHPQNLETFKAVGELRRKTMREVMDDAVKAIPFALPKKRED